MSANPRPTDARPILNGSILQLWLTDDWNAARWADECSDMTLLGMTHIIPQWTVDASPRSQLPPHAFYPTRIQGLAQRPPDRDCVHLLLSSAANHRLKVWLGLVWNSVWFEKYANDDAWLVSQFDLSIRVAEELWNRYRSDFSEIIAGFYVPFEVDNVNFLNGTHQDRVARQYVRVCRLVHGFNKPVMVAPFFNQNTAQAQGPRQHAEMWGRILRQAPIDVIALQDGIGAQEAGHPPHCTLARVADWFGPLKSEIEGTRPETKCWSDLETFEEASGTKRPAAISRVIQQLTIERRFVEQFTSFSFNHYDSRHKGYVSQFNEYKRYVEGE